MHELCADNDVRARNVRLVKKQTRRHRFTLFAFPSIADIVGRWLDVRFVPILLQKSVEGFREQ